MAALDAAELSELNADGGLELAVVAGVVVLVADVAAAEVAVGAVDAAVVVLPKPPSEPSGVVPKFNPGVVPVGLFNNPPKLNEGAEVVAVAVVVFFAVAAESTTGLVSVEAGAAKPRVVAVVAAGVVVVAAGLLKIPPNEKPAVVAPLAPKLKPDDVVLDGLASAEVAVGAVTFGAAIMDPLPKLAKPLKPLPDGFKPKLSVVWLPPAAAGLPRPPSENGVLVVAGDAPKMNPPAPVGAGVAAATAGATDDVDEAALGVVVGALKLSVGQVVDGAKELAGAVKVVAGLFPPRLNRPVPEPKLKLVAGAADVVPAAAVRLLASVLEELKDELAPSGFAEKLNAGAAVAPVVVTVVADWFDVVVAGLLKLNGVVEPKLKDILFL